MKKITKKINALEVGKKLEEGVFDGGMTFVKGIPIMRFSDEHIDLTISYQGLACVAIERIENGLTDEQLEEGLRKLHEKVLDKINTDFYDFDRKTLGRVGI